MAKKTSKEQSFAEAFFEQNTEVSELYKVGEYYFTGYDYARNYALMAELEIEIIQNNG